MNVLLLVVGILLAIILSLLIWSGGKKSAAARDEVWQRKGIHLTCKHLGNLPQMRQALESADFAYVEERLGKRSAQQLQRERRHVALRYLEALHQDFVNLMRAAQVIASLSPEVEATHEWRRFKLNVKFEMKYRFLRAKYALGNLQFPAMWKLAILVSTLAIDLEHAVNEMGAAAILGHDKISADR